MENNALWIPVIAGVSGAIIALLGVFVSSWNQRKIMEIQLKTETERHELVLKREKLEDLYILFEVWQCNVGNFFMMYTRYHYGKLTIDQVHESLTDRDKILGEKGDYQKFVSILNLYFRELVPEFNHVFWVRGKAARYCSDKKQLSDIERNDFLNAQREFEHECELFRLKMVEYSLKL